MTTRYHWVNGELVVDHNPYRDDTRAWYERMPEGGFKVGPLNLIVAGDKCGKSLYNEGLAERITNSAVLFSMEIEPEDQDVGC